jgi:multidrug resistance protein, MATE family
MLSFVPKLLRLAWPVTLARLGIMGMGLCDVIVVGQLAPDELADQALGWAYTGVALVTGIGLLTGVQVLASRALGAGRPEAAGGALQRGLGVAAISGALCVAAMWLGGPSMFSAFGIAPELAVPAAAVMRVLALSIPLHFVYVVAAFFLESIQRPMASTVVMGLANLLNLVMNLWLVPEHGAIGSAWATVVARAFLAGTLLVWVFALPDARRFGLRQRAHGPSYREFLGVGFAAAVSQAAEAGAFNLMTLFAGRIGAQAVAAYQILLNISAVVFMLALGLSSATMVITSEAIGRDAPRDAARASWTGIGLNCVLMLAVGLGLALAPDTIASAYTADATLVATIAGLLPLVAALILPDGGQGVASAGLRAHRDNWFPTVSHLAAYALLMPGLAWLLGEHLSMGVRGLMYAILWASVFSFGVLGVRLWQLTRSALFR